MDGVGGTRAAPRTGPLRSAWHRVRDPLLRMASALVHLGSPYQRYLHAKALHAIRVAAAMGTTIAITRALELPHGVWASVSVLTVIGGIQHHGNIRRKGLERALGTVLGAAAGLLLILLYGYVGSLTLTNTALALIAGICAYHAIGRGGYIALLTAITMIIVGGHGENSLDTGLWRTLNVIIGVVIALAFSFVLPLHASFSWRYMLALNLRRAAHLVQRVLAGEILDAESRNAAFAELTRRSISVRGLMPSVAREMNVAPALLEEIQNHHRSVLASLELISVAQLAEGDRHAVLQALQDQGKTIRTMLLTTARALRGGHGAGLADAGMRATSRANNPVDPESPRKDDCLGISHGARAATPAGAAMRQPDMPPSLQGPYWVMCQTKGQLERLRKSLAALPWGRG